MKVSNRMKRCRHCGKPLSKWPRGRGLCWPCSRDPEIRLKYPSESKYGFWADGETTMQELAQRIVDMQQSPKVGRPPKLLPLSSIIRVQKLSTGYQLQRAEDSGITGIPPIIKNLGEPFAHEGAAENALRIINALAAKPAACEDE